MDILSHITLNGNKKGTHHLIFTFIKLRKDAPSHILLGISANGYPVSDNRTLNYDGVVPSHI